jgi:hypothetical protein
LNDASQDRARKWMWISLAALVALQFYFVWQLLAAFLLFTLGFAVLAGVALVFYLVEEAGQLSLAWVEPRTRVVAGLAHRGLVLLEELSKKPFRRPRSETAQ